MYEKTRLDRYDWVRLQSLVVPSLRDNPREYLRLAEAGLAQVDRLLSAVHSPAHLLVPDTLRAIHKLALGDVYSFAGSFRERGENARVGDGTCKAAYYSRIEPELARLADHTKRLLFRAGTPEERAQAIVLCHAQFNRIQPFLDGSGRISMKVLQAQGRLILGKELHPVLEREDYLSSLGRAQKYGDLGPLSYMTTEKALPEHLRRSDYRMELWPVTFEKRSTDGRVHTIRCKDHVQARLVETHSFKELVEMREKLLAKRSRPKELDREM